MNNKRRKYCYVFSFFKNILVFFTIMNIRRKYWDVYKFIDKIFASFSDFFKNTLDSFTIPNNKRGIDSEIFLISFCIDLAETRNNLFPR